jgi:ABC-2 type transport system ATP-binding protein
LGIAALNGIPGIEKVNDYGQVQELRLSPGTETQNILVDVMRETRVLKFEVTKPSLNDIFIRIAAPERKEENHA